MVLLKLPPNDCRDLSQVQTFADQNQKLLELFARDAHDTEETQEIAKYRDFYKDVKFMAELALYEIEDDENAVRAMGAKLVAMTEEAERKQNSTYSKVLPSLYYDFIGQHGQLVEILKFVFQKFRVLKSEAAKSEPTVGFDFSKTEIHKNTQRSGIRRGIELSGSTNKQFCFSPNERISPLQHDPSVKEHQQNKRKNPVSVEECKVKANCVGVQTSLTLKVKGTQTEATEMVVDQGTAGDGIAYVPNVDYHRNEEQQKLKREISNSINTPNSGIQESIFKLTNLQTPRKLNAEESKEMLQKLGKIGNSTFISSEDIQKRINPKGREFEAIPFGYRHARQTLGTSCGSNALVKLPAARRSDCDKTRPNLTTVSQLRTLEDSLKFFGLFPRLQQLEESLEHVRRRRRTAADHGAECKRFDKDLQKLSREYHPDSVMKRGGSEEEVARAKEFQTALNATRTVLNTIHKTFLEDIDIDHRYEFFTKLDIGLLGNEDEVENRVYEVLFKISLVSDIKQENIIAEIRRFLTAARRCVENYLQSDKETWVKLRDTAFFYLKRCVEGYQKLHAELAEVEEECRSEKLHNIYPLLRRMRCDCSEHLKHLEALLELTKLPLGEHFEMYRSSRPVDDYFVLPFIRYTNVLMTCSLMFRDDTRSTSNGWSFFTYFQKSRSSAKVPVTELCDDKISSLHHLATRYHVDDYNYGKHHKRSVKEQFGRGQHISEEYIKEEFLVRLKAVQVELENEFEIDDYIENGTTRHIMKELKICKEMKAEFEEKRKEAEKYLEEIKENNETMRKRLDTLFLNSQKVSRQLNECLADTKMVKGEIENLTGKKKNRIE